MPPLHLLGRVCSVLAILFLVLAAVCYAYDRNATLYQIATCMGADPSEAAYDKCAAHHE